jgi:lysozyme
MRADIVDMYQGDAYVGNKDIADFAKAKASGIKGVIHKTSQYVRDKFYEQRREKALQAGLLWGAYHFGTTYTWSTQVDFFLSIAPPSPDTFPFLDHEAYLGHSLTLQDAINFMDAVDQKYGRACGLYSGALIKQQIIRATDTQREFLSQHPFWLAQYGALQLYDFNKHPLPWEPKNGILWQFTGDGQGSGPHSVPGIGNGIDISQLVTDFDDDLSHLEQWWKTGKVG